MSSSAARPGSAAAMRSRPCRAGDLVFAPAHAEHRFEDISADFATWVLFYGPEGGEAA